MNFSTPDSLAAHAAQYFTAHLTPQLRAQCAAIRCLILDVDGVLTDGSMYYDAHGEALKRFHVLDGLGIKLMQKIGITIAIISARTAPCLTARATELGITEVQQGAHQKGVALDHLLTRLAISEKECAFIGDDIIDLPILRRVGLACAPSTAHPLLAGQAHYVTKAKGGNGAVREVCDTILAVQGHWHALLTQDLAS